MLRGGEDFPDVVEGLKKLDKIEIVPETPNWKDQIIKQGNPGRCGDPHWFPDQRRWAENQTPSKIYNYEGELNPNLRREGRKVHEDYRDRVVKERLAAKNLPETVLSLLK